MNKRLLIFGISTFVIFIWFLLKFKSPLQNITNSCFFKRNYKLFNIEKLEFNKTNEFEQFHNLKIYFDYTNIDKSSISEKKRQIETNF